MLTTRVEPSVTLQLVIIATERNWHMTDKIMRRPDVEAMTGLGRSTIYDWMAKGKFPKPVRLGLRAVGWRESDIIGWMKDLNPSDAV